MIFQEAVSPLECVRPVFPSGMGWAGADDSVIVRAEGTEHRLRRFRSVTEKRQIVEVTVAPGASVALHRVGHPCSWS